MSPNVALVLALLSGLLGGGVLVGCWLKWAGGRTRRHTRRASARGYAGEAAAPEILRSYGYLVIETQPRATYDFWIDDVVETAEMCPDFLVCRDGRTLVAEVKTGAGRLATRRNTRRQLLEYSSYFDVDGVVLVDAESNTVFEVEFPLLAEPDRVNQRWVTGLVGIGFGALLCALLCGVGH